MFNKLIFVLCLSLIIASCSQTIKSPISGKPYKLNVGSTSDMDKYNKARQEAIRKEDADCNIRIIDCPETNNENTLD